MGTSLSFFRTTCGTIGTSCVTGPIKDPALGVLALVEKWRVEPR